MNPLAAFMVGLLAGAAVGTVVVFSLLCWFARRAEG